jgi:uncharacterized protein YcaQ
MSTGLTPAPFALALAPMTIREARRLALRAQLLASPRRPKGADGAARAIEHLGYVQLDTIAVIERAHHHTLWTRVPGYEPRMLDRLLSERRVFEFWGHAASYLPMTDYRIYRRRMTANPRRERWARDHRSLLDVVLDRVRKEGPLGTSDFEHKGRRRGSWWDWKPAKTALETLHAMGLLMVAERRNFQRIFDLTQRVLPQGTDTTEPDDAEIARFAVRRCLRAHGLATARQIKDHLWIAAQSDIDAAVAELLDSGELTRLAVGDNGGYYAFTRVLASRSRAVPPEVHILSPFDNLVIQRPRLRALFGLDYTLECYVPAPKRKYGYFVLPVLYGDEFIARLDPKVERGTRTFHVRRLSFEPGFKDSEAALPALARKLADFARFNGADAVELHSVTPTRWKPLLRRELTASA